MAVVGEAEVHVPDLDSGGTQPGRFAGRRSLALYRQLAQLAAETDSLIVEQLHHPGGQVWYEEQRAAYAPSAYPQPRSYSLPLPLTEQAIASIVRAFGEAARTACDCGLGGVEIKADQGKLIHQFLSSEYNRRSDRYGGDLVGRATLLVEILGEVRRQVSKEFIIGVRMAGAVTPPPNLGFEAGSFRDITVGETVEVCKRIESEGLADYLSISGETNSTVWGYRQSHGDEGVPETTFAGVARAVKSNVGLPVLLAGRILDLDAADRLVRDEVCDAVGMARALIADAELVATTMAAANGASGSSQTRPCISYNLSCVGSTWYGGQIACVYDPLCGRESRFPRVQPLEERRFAVIGGGPAGLEFARSAAMYGARVVLFEQGESLGGRLRSWSALPGRRRVELAINFWQSVASRDPRIEIRLNTQATPELLAEQPFDAWVWAVGAEEALPVFVDGQTHGHLTATAAISKTDWDGVHVVVVEGDRFGDPLGIALHAAQAGASVDIVSPFDGIGVGLDPVTRAARIDELARYRVQYHTWADIRPSRSKGAILFDHCRNKISPMPGVDLVVWLVNRLPRAVSSTLNPPSFRIGDCVWPRGLEVATKEAHDLAYKLIFEQHPKHPTPHKGVHSQ